MSHTLLIFDSFGEEDLTLYLIPDAPAWLALCHRNYMNGCEPGDVLDALSRVNDALCETPECFYNAKDPLAGAWVRFKISDWRILPSEEISIVVTGFIP